MHPRSLFSLAEHLERLSKDGDPLEVLAGTVEFERFRPLLTRGFGYLAMGGQIVDATLVPAPKQRNTEDEKAAIKAGKSARQIWRGKPNKAHQKDVDARWTVKTGGKIRYRPDGTPLPQIATPVFGYKSHISIDRRYGFIRKAAVTSATQSDGRQLRRVIDTSNTAGDVWAESACRSQKNRYGLFIRTIGIARAQAKLTLANLAYNFDRLIFHERCATTG